MTQALSLLLMVRLDRVVLMKGFEFCDVGKVRSFIIIKFAVTDIDELDLKVCYCLW